MGVVADGVVSGGPDLLGDGHRPAPKGAVELFELLGLLDEELLAVGGAEASGTGFGEGALGSNK